MAEIWCFFVIGILSLIILLLFDYVKNIQFYKHAAKIPGPKAFPIVGNALRFLGKDSSVPLWRAHRKLIQPAFNPQTLRSFLQIFDKCAISMVEKMGKKLDEGEFEVEPYFTSISLSIALEGTMGIVENSDSKEYARYTECVNRATALMMTRAYRPWLHPDIIFNFTEMSKEFTKCVNWMHNIAHTIIEKKKLKLSKTGEEEKDEISIQRKGFLDLLLDLQDQQKLSDQDISDEVNLMIVGAYETVAVSLEYLMLVLASYPDIQEKVYQELNHIYGKVIPENVSITTDDLKQMEYTERVIQESLRLFPTVPVVLRKVEEDIKIEGGCIIPKGTTALCFITKIHRDEKYWPDPLKFDPDRFLPDEVAKRNPYCYLPFSKGPRNCIGSVYAMMEMKTILTRILLKYVIKKEHIQPIKNIKQKLDVMSHPVEPITVQIVKRLS
ncbi:cytochrome P450 4C1-like isoform X2 [Belonocnema kinseyi]|uniref:cytochrome P450 4C1-like isoform X2 n=1 Tax=Belonocnema kinseyi TaxID=2817044 RepID=UPI00143DC5EE|nr:cytochrome P450 4C1-like isoform X2 [Belonocnema kinseyi]